MQNVLIIDDEVPVCTLLSRFLVKKGYNAEYSTSGAAAMALLREKRFDFILCDYHLQDINGKDLFKKIREAYPQIIVIFITGYADVRIAVDLIKDGAYHYFSKPLYPDEILKILDKAAAEGNMPRPESIRDELHMPRPAETWEERYVTGVCQQAQDMLEHVELVAPTDFGVIVYGETGTGKEALARLIHKKSKRKEGPFVAIDCGSLSKELAASELFGHEKGAFTGATQAKTGAFEQAQGGTLFLDEISNLSYEIQVYLLRAIQEKSVRRVGAIKDHKVDIRIIVASNENLYERVQNKSFREDLYHRLNEFTLKVPPLRDRGEDLEIFIDTFIKSASRELGKHIEGLSEPVLELFQHYHWPGNIRELKNVVKRACLLTPEGKEVLKTVLPLELLNSQVIRSIQQDLSRQTAKQDPLALPGEDPYSLKSAAALGEHKRIMEVLKQVKFNKTKAAEILNIDRKTLYNKLRMMQIK